MFKEAILALLLLGGEGGGGVKDECNYIYHAD